MRSFMETKRSWLPETGTTTAGGNPWLDIIFRIPGNASRVHRFQLILSVPSGYFGYPNYRAKIQLDDGNGNEPSGGEICNFDLKTGLIAPTLVGVGNTNLAAVGLMDAELPGHGQTLGVVITGIVKNTASFPFSPYYVPNSAFLEVS